MEQLIVQRKVEVWIEDVYDVEKITEDIINKAIDYDIDSRSTETIYETIEDLGPIKVYDENWKLLLKKP